MQPNTLHKVSEHVWWFTPESRTDRASLALVIGEHKSLMLEAGASPAHTQQFLQALTDAGLSQPDYAVLTHWHWDHSFGMEALNIPLFAYRDTAQNIKRMMGYNYDDAGLAKLVADGIEVEFIREHIIIEMTDDERKNLKLRIPEIVFDGELTFNLGGVTCHVEHVGGDHSADSCVMHIPEDKVLFLGDCLYMTVYEEPRHYTKAKLLPLIEKIKAIDATQFIEGHSDEIVLYQQITQYFSLIRHIYDAIAEHGHDDYAKIRNAVPDEYKDSDTFFDDFFDFVDPIVAGSKMHT
jgi:glyoxylase-like metal-dependent hydrolase (beta-lactamase superfamily II)